MHYLKKTQHGPIKSGPPDQGVVISDRSYTHLPDVLFRSYIFINMTPETFFLTLPGDILLVCGYFK